jgi:hypothetical protein
LNEYNFLHYSKIQRQFEKYGSEMAKSYDAGKPVFCLMFDGRKDQTLSCSYLADSDTFLRSNITEEHYVLVEEPGGIYRDHVSPATGRAVDVKEELLKFLQRTKSENTLSVLGTDGTAVNTGQNGGVIRLLEIELKRPIQWAICQLHLNELPFRHLFEFFDGKPSDPESYSGPIGKAITDKDLRLKPVVKFKKVKGRIVQLPNDVIANFTGDQKYFYEICLSIRRGVVSNSLAVRNCGKICQSRWLTKASSILRLYVSSTDPSDSLKR